MLYCHLWPVLLHHTLSHYLINGTIFREKVAENKGVFFKLKTHIACMILVSVKSLSQTFRILKRIHLDTVINIRTSSCKVPVILARF
jgi:hypothetical protein